MKTFLISIIIGVSSHSLGQAPDVLWTETFGGSDNEVGYSVQQTTDGGYIIAGSTESFGAGNADVWLVKTDASGDTLWTKTFGGSELDIGYSVQQTLEGGYIIAGVSFSFGADVWLIKTDASGDTLWTKTFGGSNYDFGRSVQQTIDGGYIIAGYTRSFGAGDEDVWLIKTDASGDTLWTKTFGGSITDVGYSVGGGYIAGFSESFGAGDGDFWLIKTDASGDTLWTNTFGGIGTDCGYSVQQTTDGGCIITGYTRSFGAGNEDVWLVKTDASGDTLWTKTIGGIDTDRGYSVQQTTDGGYIIVGHTSSFGAGASDVWLIKTTPDVSEVESNTNLIPSDFSLYQNYPNPFNPSTTISWQVPVGSWQTFKIYDVLGNEVATLVDEYKPAGSYEVEWNASGLPSGIYFYQLKTENFIETKKMILMQ